MSVLGVLGVSGLDDPFHGWFVIVAAVIGGVLFLLMRDSRFAGLWALVAGVAGVAVALNDRHHIAVANAQAQEQAMSAAQPYAQVGWGLNVALIASISLAIAGIVWAAASGEGTEQGLPALSDHEVASL